MKTKTMSKLLALLLSVVMAVGIMPMTALSTELLTSISGGITSPALGEKPSYFTWSNETDKYDVSMFPDMFQWSKGDSISSTVAMKDDEKFEAGQTYWAGVCVTPEEGYVLNDKTTATINGSPAQSFFCESDGSRAIYVVSFKFTSDGCLIFHSASATVTVPTAGKTPTDIVATPGDSKKYHATFSASICKKGDNWTVGTVMKSTDTFEAGQKYWVGVLFETQYGYLFDKEATATINGMSAKSSYIATNGSSAVFYVPFSIPVAPTQPTTQQPTTPIQQPTTPAAPAPQPLVTTTVKKPKATSIKKLSKAKKSFKVTYKKISGVTGYQVKYSTSKKYTKKTTKTVTIKGAKKTSKTIKKLKAKKKYYVKVRTYKTVNGKKIYSSWSKTKTVTTK